MLYQVDLLVFDRSSISRAVSIKFDPLWPLGLPSVKFNLMLDRSDMNGLVGKASLRFYQGILLIESHYKISDASEFYFSLSCLFHQVYHRLGLTSY
jgi:hypothetical protein